MINIPKIYSQKASAWKNVKIGNSNLTLGDFGCLVSDLSMIARYYEQDVNPKELNAKLRELGGFDSEGCYYWGSLSKLFPKIKENYKRTDYKLNDSDIDSIKNYISNGYPVMLWIDYNPKTVANNMHWVIAVDYDSNDEDNFTIIDPIDGQMRSLKNYLGWFIPSARRSIEAYVAYIGDVKKAPETSNFDDLSQKIASLEEKIRNAVNILNN